MSIIGSEDTAAAGPAWDDEALRILDQLDADNERYILVNSELRDLLEDAVTREVALERRVDSLLAEVASGVSQIASLCAERDSVLAESTSARGENASARGESASARAANASARAEVASARADNASIRAENASLRSEIGDLRAQLGRVEAEIEALYNTKVMRAAAPFRALYARVRRVDG